MSVPPQVVAYLLWTACSSPQVQGEGEEAVDSRLGVVLVRIPESAEVAGYSVYSSWWWET